MPSSNALAAVSVPPGDSTRRPSGMRRPAGPRKLGRSELILAMRLDGHVRGGVRDAGQAEAIARLVVVEESLVRLVDGALDDLPRAARARACAARVGQLNALLLGLVQDVHVLLALEGLLAVR